MSLAQILKNIYSFLKLLESAHGSSVTHWNRQSLGHAFKWANYCQQIYQQANGKPYATELDQQLKAMSFTPWSLGDLQINLKLMEFATKHLRMVLMQNPNLSMELFEDVLRQYGAIHSAPELLLQECYELSQAKSRVRIAAAIRDTVLPPAGERGKLTDEAVVAEARLVLRYVRWTIRVGPCLTGRTLSLEQKLTSLASTQHGLQVLLTATLPSPLSSPLPSPLSSSLAAGDKTDTELCSSHDAQALVLRHILRLADSDTSGLWKLPESILGQVCTQHFKFFAPYIRHLVKEAEPNANTDGAHSTSCEDISSRLRSLLSTTGHVSSATCAALQALATSSRNNIWRELLSSRCQ